MCSILHFGSCDFLYSFLLKYGFVSIFQISCASIRKNQTEMYLFLIQKSIVQSTTSVLIIEGVLKLG